MLAKPGRVTHLRSPTALPEGNAALARSGLTHFTGVREPMSKIRRTLALLLVVAQAPRASAQAPAAYDVVLAERNLMIPTRDGKRMATDIYRPARNGIAVMERLPALLQRTPYDKPRPASSGCSAWNCGSRYCSVSTTAAWCLSRNAQSTTAE